MRTKKSKKSKKSASTKSHASGKIKNRSFRILRMKSNVFLTLIKMQPCGVIGAEKHTPFIMENVSTIVKQFVSLDSISV